MTFTHYFVHRTGDGVFLIPHLAGNTDGMITFLNTHTLPVANPFKIGERTLIPVDEVSEITQIPIDGGKWITPEKDTQSFNPNSRQAYFIRMVGMIKTSVTDPHKHERIQLGDSLTKNYEFMNMKLMDRLKNHINLEELPDATRNSLESFISVLSFELSNKQERTFTESEIAHLQNDVHKITGNGSVMQLFNSLLGIGAGSGN